MNHSGAIGLINNAALLLALCLLYEMLGPRLQERKTLIQQVLTGIVLGAIGLAIMSNPWNFGQGVVFDTRSVLLAISGFFFGTIPVLLAVLMTGFFRFLSGGAGVWTGLAVIVTSGVIGLLWRHFRPLKHQKPSIAELYLLGIVVHIAMLGWFFLLPWPLVIDVLGKISLPVMFIYPIATAILGNLMVMSEKRRHAEQELRESEERYRELVENANSIILRMDKEGRISFFNEYAQGFFGFPAEEILGRSVIGTIVPATDSAGVDLDTMIKDIGVHPQYYVTNDNENMLRDGTRVWVSWTNKPIFNEANEVSEILCVGNDITERKHSEEFLRESEERNRLLADLTLEGIVIHKNGAAENLNASMAKMLGFARDELLGRNFFEFIHEDDCAIVHQNIKKDSASPYTIRMLRKNGERFFAEIESRNIHMQGEVRRVSAVRDITERKEAEERKIAGEERHRMILQTAMDGFWVVDTEGRVLEVNETYCWMSGYTEQELLSMHITDLEAQETVEDTAAHMRKVLAGGEDRFESRHRRKDGTFFDVEIRTQYSSANGGMVVVFLRDITEHKDWEEKLKESEERFKALHNASFGGIAIHDKGLILDCNQGLSEISGFAVEELIGMDGLLLIAPDSRELVRSNIVSGYEKPYEAKGIRKNGEEYPLRLEARNVPYKGTMVRCVEFRDISEQKISEAEREGLRGQLLQAQKIESVGRLAGGVAHDFNNMLSVILGRTEMAQETLAPSEPIQKDLEEIRKAAERSANLTRQLLAFARKQTIAPKVLNFNNAVSGMLKMIQRLIGEDIDLVWLPFADLWSIKMDPSQLDQILANLCVNARDAIAGVGKLTIETENVTFDDAYCANNPGFNFGEYVLLALSDNGCGMDRETLTHLYEPFFTTKEMGKGTGLGLATVYGIVKQNNGFINVYSEPGQGTTFKIYLPRYKEKAEAVAQTTLIQPAARGLETILLVEDEAAILAMTRTMLERLGYTVLPANSPGEAIQLAESHTGQINLLLTDVVMPEMNGRDLARHLLSLYPDIKPLFMSGYTANVIAHHGVLDEGVQFIEKPFAKKDLAAKIREVLNQNLMN
jgi:two-component system, cell cycle sensor histidine kinase and response regulator CckA